MEIKVNPNNGLAMCDNPYCEFCNFFESSMEDDNFHDDEEAFQQQSSSSRFDPLQTLEFDDFYPTEEY